jgi:3-phosphoshikimate 1-carboxyvinyltransferase
MPKSILINKKINSFKKKINVNPDKSLSIRFAILASLAIGKSKAFNLSDADDIKTTLACLKNLGVPIKFTKNYCEITGKGLFNYKI